MATGDITATTTAYATMELLNTALYALSTGGATASADTTTYFITPGRNCFFLTKIVRSA
jgi:hypothetical protein